MLCALFAFTILFRLIIFNVCNLDLLHAFILGEQCVYHGLVHIKENRILLNLLILLFSGPPLHIVSRLSLVRLQDGMHRLLLLQR